ncbi:putative integral membrane protein [Acanthocheilonema viteae]
MKSALWNNYWTIYRMVSMQIIFRIVLKIFQFICSAFVVYCMYRTGSNWILTLSSLLVPPFGIYLILRSTNRKNQYDRCYGAVERSWFRVEIAICFTMTVVFLGFGILLLYGFLKLMDNTYFLLAGLSSVLAALLYMTNGLVTVGLLRQDNTDIAVNEEALKQKTCIAYDDPNHFSISMISREHNRTMGQNQEFKRQPIVSIENTSAISMRHQNDASPCAGQRSEIDQHIIDYIRAELDRNLNSKTNKHNNSSTNYNIDDCKNSKNNDTINDVVTISSRERYRYAPARNSNISKSGAQCNQKLQKRFATISSRISKCKVTPISLFAPVKTEDLDDNHRTEHFNAYFLATQKNDPLLVNRIANNVKSDTVSRSVELPAHRQDQQRNAGEGGIITREHYSKRKNDSWKYSGYERFSDDDNTSGLFTGSIYYNNNSVPVELKNVDLAVQPELFVVEMPDQNIRDCNRSGRGSQRRCYSKYDNRRGSADIHHPSYTTHTESDDESSSSPTNYGSVISNKQQVLNLSREQESINSSCMPSIVTAIDSGRESDIIRNNSPRRTSSRDKKMRNREKVGNFRAIDVVMRAENDGERFEGRRRTLSASSFSYDKPAEAYLVTEF